MLVIESRQRFAPLTYVPFSFTAPFSIIIFFGHFLKKSILLILSYIFSHTLTYFNIFLIQKFHVFSSSLLPHQHCLLWCWQRFVSFVKKWENYFCCIPVLRLWWWLVGALVQHHRSTLKYKGSASIVWEGGCYRWWGQQKCTQPLKILGCSYVKMRLAEKLSACHYWRDRNWGLPWFFTLLAILPPFWEDWAKVAP